MYYKAHSYAHGVSHRCKKCADRANVHCKKIRLVRLDLVYSAVVQYGGVDYVTEECLDDIDMIAREIVEEA